MHLLRRGIVSNSALLVECLFLAEAVSKRTHQSEVFEIGLREAPTTASAGDGKAKAPPQNLVILSFDTASADQRH